MRQDIEPGLIEAVLRRLLLGDLFHPLIFGDGEVTRQRGIGDGRFDL
ncbi:MAG: hypothetical protein ISS57_15200 [Anaerolineales bacterium]|nr:hypothetical protein [Anaerolineales bacterium]